MQLKYEVFARWFAMLMILQICMPHLAEGGISLSGLTDMVHKPSWLNHHKQKEQEIPNGCFKQTLKEPDPQDPYKYIETERLVCPNSPALAEYPQSGPVQFQQPPQIWQPYQTEQHPLQPGQILNAANGQHQYPQATEQQPLQPVQQQIQPQQVQPQLPPSQQSQSFYPVQQSQFPHASNPGLAVQTQFQQPAEDSHFPQPAENTETTTERPKFFQSLVDKVIEFKNTKGQQLKEAASTIVSKYQTYQASKAEKHSEQANLSVHPVQNATSQDSSKKKGFFSKSSSGGIWKFNIISMLLIPFLLILLQ